MQPFNFQSLLVRGMTKNVKINKPMLTNRQKVLSGIIRSFGAVINVRNMVKNIRNITTQTVKGQEIYSHIYLMTFEALS